MTDLGKPGKRVLLRALGLGTALALAACSAPGGGFVSGPEEPPRAEKALPAVSWEESPVEEPEEDPPADGLPQAIPLEASEEPPPALEAGDPDAALASEDVVFSDRMDSGVELEIRRASPVPDNGTIFYDVYALTRAPEGDWTVLGRLADYNHYVGNFGLDVAERVPDILGREGWQVSLAIGAAAVKSWFFAASAQGAEFLFDVGSSGSAQVLDLDGDGQGEAWEFYNHGEAGWSLYDRDGEGRLWRYFLPVGPEAPQGAVMDPEKGFVPADPEGSPLLGGAGNPRYLLENGALRLRMEESP